MFVFHFHREVVVEGEGYGIPCQEYELYESSACNLGDCNDTACIIDGVTYEDNAVVSDEACHIWYVIFNRICHCCSPQR